MSKKETPKEKDKKGGFFGGKKDKDDKRASAAMGNLGSSPALKVDFTPDPNAVKCFGSPLETLMNYERTKWPNKEVPLLIEKSLEFLTTKGLEAEGIFRVPGSEQSLKTIGGAFDGGRGDVVNFDKGEPLSVEPADVASLLKKYLRDLPDSLFTKPAEEQFLRIMAYQSLPERVQAYRQLITRLPPVNQAVVKKLLFFLMQVSINSEMNLMNSQNLATVFGVMAGVFASNSGELVQWLIENYFALYEEADLKLATTEPVFQRKMVGHVKSVLGLIRNGDSQVWSCDSSGMMQIRDAHTFQLIRRFSMGDRPNSLPAIYDGRLWSCFGNEVRVWDLSRLTNPEIQNPEKEFKRVGFEGYVAALCVKGNEIWTGGEQLVVLTKDLWKKELSSDRKNVVTALQVVDNNVWAIKGKSIQVWDGASYSMIKEIPDCVNQVGNITVVGNEVWLPGSVGADGLVWVIDKNSYQLTQTLKRHKGTVYHCAQIGNLVWTASWDRSVCTWDLNSKQFVRTIVNPHIDAISWIEPVFKREMNGWQVWTGSYDKTINILFVPASYAGAAVPQTPSLTASSPQIPLSTAPPARQPPPPVPSVHSRMPSNPPPVPSGGPPVAYPPVPAGGNPPPPVPTPSYPSSNSNNNFPLYNQGGSGTPAPPPRNIAQSQPAGPSQPGQPVQRLNSAPNAPVLGSNRRQPPPPPGRPGQPLPPNGEQPQQIAPPPSKVVDYQAEQANSDPSRFMKSDFFIEVAFDYDAQSDLETFLRVGERFHVFETDPEGSWYHGHGADPKRMGWFPAAFVRPAESL